MHLPAGGNRAGGLVRAPRPLIAAPFHFVLQTGQEAAHPFLYYLPGPQHRLPVASLVKPGVHPRRRRQPTIQWYGGPFPEPPPSWRRSSPGPAARWSASAPSPSAWTPESRRCTSPTFISHCLRNRSISLTPITNPSQFLRPANPVTSQQVYPMPLRISPWLWVRPDGLHLLRVLPPGGFNGPGGCRYGMTESRGSAFQKNVDQRGAGDGSMAGNSSPVLGSVPFQVVRPSDDGRRIPAETGMTVGREGDHPNATLPSSARLRAEAAAGC